MPSHSGSMGLDVARALLARSEQLAPAETDLDRIMRYRDDPVAFAVNVLGITPWSRQAEIVAAPLEHERVAVVSGHKTGKSTALAVIALWFYSTRPGARVVIMATTDRQVNGIIWREIKRLVRGARVPIPGAAAIKVRASSGLTDPADFSEIRGYTAREAEAVAGVSGANILYLVDEASGVAQAIFEAIEGNRAGGSAFVFLISNPTRAEGEFYDAFHGKSSEALGSAGYHTIRIDSRESPNVTGEWREISDAPVPGLATPGWVEEKRREWGEESAMFQVRIVGSFVVAEESKVFQLDLLTAAQTRWGETTAEGRLYIGVDPAGDGDGGDESAFVARRGRKVTAIRARSGLAPMGHVTEVEDIIAAEGRGTPLVPIVSVESEGEAGWKVYVALREHADRTRAFEVSRVRTSQRAMRRPLEFDRVREELWANAREWMRDGGAIPEHAKLERDLHAPEFASNMQGRLKLTAKRDLKKMLGRSPDVGDAFCLSVWEPMSARVQEAPPPAHPEHDDWAAPTLDPYDGAGAWR